MSDPRRDLFAAAALQGLLAAGCADKPAEIAKQVWEIVEAMDPTAVGPELAEPA